MIHRPIVNLKKLIYGDSILTLILRFDRFELSATIKLPPRFNNSDDGFPIVFYRYRLCFGYYIIFNSCVAIVINLLAKLIVCQCEVNFYLCDMRSILLLSILWICARGCEISLTTVSGTHAKQPVCKGQLIFEDNFDELDLKKWQHELTLGGGGVRMTFK